jgi:hypothetical protein
MPTVLWPNYVKPGETLTVEQLLGMIETTVTILQATMPPRLTSIQNHAANCRAEMGASHDPGDEHKDRKKAYDQLKSCRDALDLTVLYMQGAEDDISHVGGGEIGKSSTGTTPSRRSGGRKTTKKTRPGIKRKVLPKRKPKPKPNPKARTKKTKKKKKNKTS